MNQKNDSKKKDPINYIYQIVNASSDGSYFSNKEFHLIYQIYMYNFVTMNKKIVGILANTNDQDNLLYFTITIPITQELTISTLLKEHIYTDKYSKVQMKKYLLENTLHKETLNYLSYILTQKMELNG